LIKVSKLMQSILNATNSNTVGMFNAVSTTAPSIALKADGGFSFSFDDGEKTVTIKFEREDVMKMVYELTKALDKSGVKYSIKTSKRKKR
jgi:hypothetical protein